MNKKDLLLALFVLILGISVLVLFAMPKKGIVTFSSNPEFLPFEIKIADMDASLQPIATCNSVECEVELDAGSYELYIEKDTYYAQNEFFDLQKGDMKYITVALERMTGTVIDAANVSDEIFEKCYGDSLICEQDFHMIEDADTNYMALWEGDTRRATFTKGMANVKIFTGGLDNGALVYDQDSGEAYFVNFALDSREFAFSINPGAELTGVQLLDDSAYLLQVGESVFWQNDEGGQEIVNGVDLHQFVYKDGYVYFIADSDNLSGYVEDITASGVCIFIFKPGGYKVILDDINFSAEDTVLGTDETGIYGKSGDSIWTIE